MHIYHEHGAEIGTLETDDRIASCQNKHRQDTTKPCTKNRSNKEMYYFTADKKIYCRDCVLGELMIFPSQHNKPENTDLPKANIFKPINKYKIIALSN